MQKHCKLVVLVPVSCKTRYLVQLGHNYTENSARVSFPTRALPHVKASRRKMTKLPREYVLCRILRNRFLVVVSLNVERGEGWVFFDVLRGVRCVGMTVHFPVWPWSLGLDRGGWLPFSQVRELTLELLTVLSSAFGRRD